MNGKILPKGHRSFIIPAFVGPAAFSLALLALAAAGRPAQDVPVSRAYKGHENDRDIGNFVRAYPAAAGTRLDDCQTCHRPGPAGTDAAREFSPCGYCHLLQYPNPRYKTGVPASYADTLNPFGLAYEKAGRSAAALTAIAGGDADGDGFANAAEVAALRYPGDPASRPGQPLAPAVTFGREEILKMPACAQFMLMNTTKEPTDDYVTYRGVRVLDLLAAVGVDLESAKGITVFAPDGYGIDYSVEDIRKPFPEGRFWSGPGKGADVERFFVRFPTPLAPGVKDGGLIPGEPWLLLAYERDGAPLEVSAYEKGSGRLTGEGPFRLVKPQRDLGGDPARPGRPDRSSKARSYGDGWDFVASLDHNAGACVRGACVIRVNPAPPGFEEYDWRNGWSLIASGRVVIYGKAVRG